MRKIHFGENTLSKFECLSVFRSSKFLDDLNKLREPMLFFQANQDVTICLDEIQLVPEFFSVLRSEIGCNHRLG